MGNEGENPTEAPEIPQPERDWLDEAGVNELSNTELKKLFTDFEKPDKSEFQEGMKSIDKEDEKDVGGDSRKDNRKEEKSEKAGLKKDDKVGEVPITIDELKRDSVTKDAANFIENEKVKIQSENLSDGTIAEAREHDGYKEIVLNKEEFDALSPEEKKATIVHEVEHLKGGDEYDARKAEADTEYSLEAKQLIYDEDGSPKDKNKVKDDLIQEYGYTEENFTY